VNNTQLESKILQVPIEDIIPNRFQPRLAFDDASLNDLATSIKQHGIIQPLVLRRKGDKYEIIAGERRYKAAKIAGLITVPAIISNLDDNASAEVAIVENVQRKNLTAIEEAKSYQTLLDKGYMTQEDLARKMGISQSAISNKLRLLTLDEEVQDAILKEKISERHARTLLKVPDKMAQKRLLNKIIAERMTVKQLEDEIKNMYGASTTTEPEDVPLVRSEPSMANIINNSTDINNTTINNPSPEVLPPSTNTTDFFSNAQSMPNKFFNFLEDQAVNMGTTEVTPTFDLPEFEDKSTKNNYDLLNQTENIEMLDDFFAPDATKNNPNKDEYLDQVINTIRGLNLNKDRVTVEEINLPNEYHINIKIKKD
jgi:ParB family chromosome partitioning protein